MYQKLLIILLLNINILNARGELERLGDVLTLAPFGMLIVSLGLKDYEGAAQLTLGALATQGTIELIKKSNQAFHDSGATPPFARRPCCEDYKGMPSGHSGGAFSAAAYVYYRYGWKPALPLIAISVLTAYTRIDARKHSVYQTAVAAGIAWSWGYFFTTKYGQKMIRNHNLLVIPVLQDDFGGLYYGVHLSYRF